MELVEADRERHGLNHTLMVRQRVGRSDRTSTARLLRMLAGIVVLLASFTVLSDRDARAQTSNAVEIAQWDTCEETVVNSSFSGNPFDVVATVTFTHARSGEVRTTEMFYDGGDIWRWRFTGTRQGEWAYSTSSGDGDLDGRTGTICVTAPASDSINGFLVAEGNRYAHMSGPDGQGRTPYLFNFYQNQEAYPWHLGKWPSDSAGAAATALDYLNEARDHGTDVIFQLILHNVLSFGALTWSEHSSTNPDLTTFKVLDAIIESVHANGGHTHFWLWGDSQREWTPDGLSGGINGTADRRLQRYIAARLGPLPGWSIGYGFDLQEWVTPMQVESWATYMHDRMGWPHLLSARGSRIADSAPNIASYSSQGDARVELFTDALYGPHSIAEIAQDMADNPNQPIIYEERHIYARQGYLSETMEGARRILWWWAMGGGAGGSYGLWENYTEPYPSPEQLRTHYEFWHTHDRWDNDYVRDVTITDGHALRTPEYDKFVFYQEGTSSLQIDLSSASGLVSAVAVDTKEPYAEIDFGVLGSEQQTLALPRKSDWAVAIVPAEDTGQTSVEYDLPGGWWLVGLPFELTGEDLATFFPDAAGLYDFDGHYVAPADGVRPGRGYWVYHKDDPAAFTIADTAVRGDTISLEVGWNLISGPACSLAVTDVDDPAGILIDGTLYGFQRTYLESQTLEAGQGYWLRAAGSEAGQVAGEIMLDCDAGSTTAQMIGASAAAADDLSDFGVIRVSDDAAFSRDLYFGSTLPPGANPLSFSLPALPPGGGFDARFAGDTKLTEHLKADVDAQSLDYPITLSLERQPTDHRDVRLVVQEILDDEIVRTYPVGSKQDVVFDEPVDGQLRLAQAETACTGLGDEVATAFQLVQNHPNPFAEQTTLRYMLPEPEKVRMVVYNALGQQVEVLVDGVKAAGSHGVTWDADEVPSGVYYCIIEAGAHRESIQMVHIR